MLSFYKIEEGKLQIGSGEIVPESFIEYTVGEEPQELLDVLDSEAKEQELQSKIQEAIQSLFSTDWKVIRELERLMLSGTELNLEREALRSRVQ